MRIRWTVPAADDLENIKNYLLEHHPHFAEPTVRAIYQRVRSLKTFPNRGTPGHRSGTRELSRHNDYERKARAAGVTAHRSEHRDAAEYGELEALVRREVRQLALARSLGRIEKNHLL